MPSRNTLAALSLFHSEPIIWGMWLGKWRLDHRYTETIVNKQLTMFVASTICPYQYSKFIFLLGVEKLSIILQSNLKKHLDIFMFTFLSYGEEQIWWHEDMKHLTFV